MWRPAIGREQIAQTLGRTPKRRSRIGHHRRPPFGHGLAEVHFPIREGYPQPQGVRVHQARGPKEHRNTSPR